VRDAWAKLDEGQTKSGPFASELRESLIRDLNAHNVALEQSTRPAPRPNFAKDRHEAGHAVAALVLGQTLTRVTQSDCAAILCRDRRDALYALAGGASERLVFG